MHSFLFEMNRCKHTQHEAAVRSCFLALLVWLQGARGFSFSFCKYHLFQIPHIHLVGSHMCIFIILTWPFRNLLCPTSFSLGSVSFSRQALLDMKFSQRLRDSRSDETLPEKLSLLCTKHMCCFCGQRSSFDSKCLILAFTWQTVVMASIHNRLKLWNQFLIAESRKH